MLGRGRWVPFFSALAKVRPLYRYGISVLLMVLTLCIWRVTILTALSTQYHHHESEINNLEKHIRLLKHIQQNNKILSEAIKHLKNTILTLPINLQQTLGSNIDFIFNQAAQSGLYIGTCLPQDEYDQGWCQEYTIFFDLNGSFENIKNFFDQIVHQNRMIRCSRLFITRNSSNSLNVACILNFYAPKNERAENE
jgi:Tfp pilus assembly protein PilO